MKDAAKYKKVLTKLFKLDSYRSVFIHIFMSYAPKVYLESLKLIEPNYKTWYLTLLKFLKFSFFDQNFSAKYFNYYISFLFKGLKKQAGYFVFFEKEFFDHKQIYEKYTFLLSITRDILIYFGKGKILPSSTINLQNKKTYYCKNVTPDFSDYVSDIFEVSDNWISVPHEDYPDPNAAPQHSQQSVKTFTFQDVFVGGYYYLLSDKHKELRNFQADLHNNILSLDTNGLGSSRKFISEESKTVILEINPVDRHCISYEEAILLSGKSSINYFHWVFEYLNKVMSIDKLEHLKKIPLIVDAQMPYQHYEALQTAFNIEDRKIIFFSSSKSVVNVKNLHVPQVPCYLSDKFSEKGLERVSFARDHLFYLRNKILQKTGNLTPDKKRIYITRKKRNRSILNERELIKILKNYGFEVYDTSYLSFAEQVRLFYSADVVIGAAGAALTNILFCRENTHVCILNSVFHQDNCLFSTLCSILGLKFKSLFGKPSYSPYSFRFAFSTAFYDHYFSPFLIDSSKLKDYLESLRG